MTRTELQQRLDQEFPAGMSKADIARFFRISRNTIPGEKFTRYEVNEGGRPRYATESVVAWWWAGRKLGVLR